jgi:hypothetical protein
MNYDVYEVEIETGVPGYRLVQHIKAFDYADAEAKVAAVQKAKVIGSSFWRPCKESEIALAIESGFIPEGTVATDINDVPVEKLAEATKVKLLADEFAASLAP